MAKLYESERPQSQESEPESNITSNDDRPHLQTASPRWNKNGTPKKPVKPISKLKALRKAEGFTLEHLSELTNISPSYLSRLEAGDRRLNTDLIQRLAKVFRCSPSDLLQEDGWGEQSSTLAEKNNKSQQLQKDLPVYKLGFGNEDGNIPRVGGQEPSNSQFLYKESPIDWAYRPAQLLQVPTAFGLYLSGPQFLPKYQEGELLLIHPSKPLSKHCSVLAVNEDNSVSLGQFVDWQGEFLHLTSYAYIPAESKSIYLEKKNLKAVYRIIGTLESH